MVSKHEDSGTLMGTYPDINIVLLKIRPTKWWSPVSEIIKYKNTYESQRRKKGKKESSHKDSQREKSR